MIELCFNPSLKGALTEARRFHPSTTVVGVDAPLFRGDITNPGLTAGPAFISLQKRAARGEAVRIWTDRTPAGACGLLFASHLLRDAPGPLWAVPLTKCYHRPDGVKVVAAHWGEVAPKELEAFADPPVLLDQTARRDLAQQWANLQQENAPLRVMENGAVHSAEITHYDGLVLSACPDHPCRVAELIGRLVNQQLGIDDWFWAERVQALLEAEALRLVEPQEGRFYEAVIARG